MGEELARELYRTCTHDLRLVSRNPAKVHDTDQLVTADLTDPEATTRAVEGSGIACIFDTAKGEETALDLQKRRQGADAQECLDVAYHVQARDLTVRRRRRSGAACAPSGQQTVSTLPGRVPAC
ncbi:hypothetical protein [Streptomyces arboris]|uniref:hypothetical protein n=1 Tax=Streptomyces arboris TaxID=2600619 RepID=UPI001CEFA678|nr:hypothetical protein [Streptomyces arboris]